MSQYHPESSRIAPSPRERATACLDLQRTPRGEG